MNRTVVTNRVESIARHASEAGLTRAEEIATVVRARAVHARVRRARRRDCLSHSDHTNSVHNTCATRTKATQTAQRHCDAQSTPHSACKPAVFWQRKPSEVGLQWHTCQPSA